MMDMTTYCRDCGRPTTMRIADTRDLAAFVVLGALCPACARVQQTARQMEET